MTDVTIYAKASAKSNPGEAAIGLILVSSRDHRREVAELCGVTSIVAAQRHAVHRALEICKPDKTDALVVYSDCKGTLGHLTPERLSGTSRWTNPAGDALRALARRFKNATFRYLAACDSLEMRQAKRLAQQLLGVTLDEEPTQKRAATDMVEEWVQAGLEYLAEDNLWRDTDRDFGESLARQVIDTGELSSKQWAAALDLVRRYQKHVGAPPGGKP